MADSANVERELEARARKQRAVAVLGQRALVGRDLQELMDIVSRTVVDVLEVEFCEILELQPDGQSLLLRAGTGWHDGLVGKELVGAERGSQAGYALYSSQAVIVDNLRTETRFSDPALLFDHGVVSSVSVIIHGASKPWGVLGTHSSRYRVFNDDDVNFVQSVANILATFIDRSLAEDALSESEQRFRTLVEMAPDAIFTISVTDGTFTSLSPAFERLTGWSRAEWLGRSFAGIIHPDDLPYAMQQFQQLQLGEPPPPFELRVHVHGGSEIIGEFRLTPNIEDGQVVELFGIARDVSDRRLAEEALRRSRDELEIILQGVAEGIAVQDRDGQLIYANEAAAQVIGFDSVEALLAVPSQSLFDRFDIYDENGSYFPLDNLPGRQALLGNSVPETLIRSLDRQTGKERWSLLSATPVFDDDGAPRYAINIFRDVSERIRSESVQDFLSEATSLMSSTLDYDATLDRVARISVPFLADLCVFDIVQPDGDIRRIVAHQVPETERLFHDLINSHPIEPAHPVMHAIQSGKVTLRKEVVPDSGIRTRLSDRRVQIIDSIGVRSVIVVPLESRGRRIGALSLMYTDSGRLYSDADLSVALELAHRSAVAVDNALLYDRAQHAAARLRALAEASHAFAEASLDLQAVLDAVARSAGELVGDQCIVRMLSDDGTLLPAVALFHADPGRRDWLAEYLQNENQLTDQGMAGSVFSTGTPIFIPTVTDEHLQEWAGSGLPDPAVYALPQSVLIVRIRERERPIGTVGLVRDRPGEPYTDDDLLLLQEMADRAGLAIENARLYREARDAVRAREQFLSIASHELKTPLTSIKGSAQLIERRLRYDPIDRSRIAPLVMQVQSEISRLEHLVMDLLDATRIQQGRLGLRREPTDLVELARQALERFEPTAQQPPAHTLLLESPDSIEANIDPGRIDQVVTNLVSNALKYSPNGGAVRVAISQVDDQIEMAVSDDGIGISDAEQATLFQPFARGDVARQSIGGTGLGLFISSEIVERHGGTISVESEPGRGSTFTVFLPTHVDDDTPETPTKSFL